MNIDNARQGQASNTTATCRWRWAVSLGVLALGVGSGCSLTVLANDSCEVNADCRGTFGHATTCDAGYCTAPVLHPRCTRAFPADFLERLDEYPDEIVIGSIYSYTDHLDTMLATELAVQEANGRGGLDGREFAIVHCDYTAMAGDDLDDIEATAAISSYLVDVMGVPAIVGPRGSARAEAAYNAIRDDDVIVISPSATSPDLTPLDGTSPSDAMPGKLWRTAPPDTLQSEVIAGDMVGRLVTDVAVVYQQGAYGDALSGLFVDRFTEVSGHDATLFPFDTAADEVGGIAGLLASDLADGTFQEVLLISSDLNDYVKFFSAASSDAVVESYLVEGVGIFLTDSAHNVQVLDASSNSAAAIFPKVRGTRPAPAEGRVFDAFAASYAAKYMMDATGSAFSPHAYDAGWLVLYGIAWSKYNEASIHGAGVGRGLRHVSGGKKLEIQPSSWPSVLDSFRSATPVNIEGASGPLDYDPATEETVAPISVWNIVPDPSAPSGFDFGELFRVNP